ncbi:MAG: hypothetical protein U1E02_14955, partial [Hydrogenophaga sp.]|nr:hypothetical protein [Hydrogenophaga sp.]
MTVFVVHNQQMKLVSLKQGKVMKRGLATIMAALALQAAAWAQTPADTALLEMREAFRRSNTSQLAALLPRVRGHALEPLAIYWNMKAQLDTAPAAEIRAAMDRMAGTYWED